jgi:hypothetical protein
MDKTSTTRMNKQIRNLIALGERELEKKSYGMASMYLGDASDLAQVAEYITDNDYTKAYTKARDMDTAARERIPQSVWDMVIQHNQ